MSTEIMLYLFTAVFQAGVLWASVRGLKEEVKALDKHYSLRHDDAQADLDWLRSQFMNELKGKR
jgi:hypothetical protein